MTYNVSSGTLSLYTTTTTLPRLEVVHQFRVKDLGRALLTPPAGRTTFATTMIP